MKAWLRAWTLGWICATAPAVAGEPIVVEAPRLAVGDRWEFAGIRNGNPSTMSIEVLELASDGRIRVKVDRPGREVVEYRDASMNFLIDGRSDRPQVAARFPLKPGGEWRFDQPTDSSNASYAGEGRVVAQRTLTVPAGTFECLEVEAEARYSVGRSYSNHYRSTRWYCPDIKWVAKEDYRSTTTSAYNPADNATVQGGNELVRFTPGKQ